MSCSSSGIFRDNKRSDCRDERERKMIQEYRNKDRDVSYAVAKPKSLTHNSAGKYIDDLLKIVIVSRKNVKKFANEKSNVANSREGFFYECP